MSTQASRSMGRSIVHKQLQPLPGRQWNLISWHYSAKRPWNPRLDDLQSHIAHCRGVLPAPGGGGRMKLRIAELHYQKMRDILALSFRDVRRSRPETGCILLVARNDHPSHPSLLVADVLEPRVGDFDNRAKVYFRFRAGIFAVPCSLCAAAVWQAFSPYIPILCPTGMLASPRMTMPTILS